MNFLDDDQFEPFIGKNVKEQHVIMLEETLLQPKEILLGIIKRVKTGSASRYLIITNQRFIKWEAGSDFMFFNYDQIINVYSQKVLAIGIGEFVLVTSDGKYHKYLTHSHDDGIAAQILQQQLQTFHSERQSTSVQNVSQSTLSVTNSIENLKAKSNIFCQNCGSDNSSTNKFCVKCGKLMPV